MIRLSRCLKQAINFQAVPHPYRGTSHTHGARCRGLVSLCSGSGMPQYNTTGVDPRQRGVPLFLWHDPVLTNKFPTTILRREFLTPYQVTKEKAINIPSQWPLRINTRKRNNKVPRSSSKCHIYEFLLSFWTKATVGVCWVLNKFNDDTRRIHNAKFTSSSLIND